MGTSQSKLQHSYEKGNLSWLRIEKEEKKITLARYLNFTEYPNIIFFVNKSKFIHGLVNC